jgi:LCP family protein required for cell wall assembly
VDFDQARSTVAGARLASAWRRWLERRDLSAPVHSFVWPGLGQLQSGRTWPAVLMAVPPLILLVVLVAWIGNSPQSFVSRLFSPAFGLGIVALIALDGVWRVGSIVDAWWRTRATPGANRGALPLVIVLGLLVVLVHGVGGAWVSSVSAAAQPIFGGGRGDASNLLPPRGDAGQADSSPGPYDGSAYVAGIDDLIGDRGEWCFADTDLPCVDAEHPIPAEGPLNVLFLGVDWTPGRESGRTDTIMVLSFDPHTGQSSQISIPRDTGRLPFYDGGVFNPRINSLLGRARRDPERFPDGPIGTLAREVGYLLGIRIHYYALLNMPGFADLVDMLGGVVVDVPYDISDDHHRFYLRAGKHHMDGETALLYARSRYGPNNNDWQRARRQQDLLRVIADKMRTPALAAKLPEIIRETAKVARTNLPVDQLSAFLDLLDQTQGTNPAKIVLQPTKYASRVPPAEVGGRYMTQLRMDVVRNLSVELFGEFSRYSRTNSP